MFIIKLQNIRKVVIKMKKLMLVTLVIVFVLSMGVLSFAETNITETPDWYEDMLKWRKDQVEGALDQGLITEEQARLWNERMEYMEEYHLENGYGYGGCGGFGMGYGQRGGRGFGHGMMGRGWGYQGF